MSILSVHSFRGGTGKSNLSANLALLAARAGARVAVLDTDLLSPGIHVILSLDPESIVYTLADFVEGRCEIREAVYDLTLSLRVNENGGALYLIPSSMKLEDISRVAAEGYDVQKLNTQLDQLSHDLDLDLLVLDTHPGLNRETMLTTAVSDVLVIVTRVDRQDVQGTAILVELAKKLSVPGVYLVANMILDGAGAGELAEKLRGAYGCEVAGVLPWSPQMARLGSEGLFVDELPDDPLCGELRSVLDRIVGQGREEGRVMNRGSLQGQTVGPTARRRHHAPPGQEREGAPDDVV